MSKRTEEGTITISPNDYIRVGDELVMKPLIGPAYAVKVLAIKGTQVTIGKLRWYRRLKFWIDERILDVKVWWWMNRPRLKR